MESKKPTWLEKAKETFKFHREKLRSHDKWTIRDTANALRRSLGSITEDLLIARWMRTHSNHIEKFDYAYQALTYIREKKKQRDMEDVDL